MTFHPLAWQASSSRDRSVGFAAATWMGHVRPPSLDNAITYLVSQGPFFPRPPIMAIDRLGFKCNTTPAEGELEFKSILLSLDAMLKTLALLLLLLLLHASATLTPAAVIRVTTAFTTTLPGTGIVTSMTVIVYTSTHFTYDPASNSTSLADYVSTAPTPFSILKFTRSSETSQTSGGANRTATVSRMSTASVVTNTTAIVYTSTHFTNDPVSKSMSLVSVVSTAQTLYSTLSLNRSSPPTAETSQPSAGANRTATVSRMSAASIVTNATGMVYASTRSTNDLVSESTSLVNRVSTAPTLSSTLSLTVHLSTAPAPSSTSSLTPSVQLPTASFGTSSLTRSVSTSVETLQSHTEANSSATSSRSIVPASSASKAGRPATSSSYLSESSRPETAASAETLQPNAGANRTSTVFRISGISTTTSGRSTTMPWSNSTGHAGLTRTSQLGSANHTLHEQRPKTPAVPYTSGPSFGTGTVHSSGNLSATFERRPRGLAV